MLVCTEGELFCWILVIVSVFGCLVSGAFSLGIVVGRLFEHESIRLKEVMDERPPSS